METSNAPLNAALRAAREDADVLYGLISGTLEVAFVCTSYDTAFEPISRQVSTKLDELLVVFPRSGPVGFSLVVVNDAPRAQASAFGRDVLAAFSQAPRWLLDEERLRLLSLDESVPTGAWGKKGLALRLGMRSLLDEGRADVVGYVNLNGKAHAAQAACGLRALLEHGWDAAVGSRAFHNGGNRQGAGLVGLTKSALWSTLVRAALPSLAAFPDVAGPMKLFTKPATRAVLERARLDDAGFDAEWLTILAAAGLPFGTFPLCWRQRAGSRPPWELTGGLVKDLVRVRRAARAGHLSPRAPLLEAKRTPAPAADSPDAAVVVIDTGAEPCPTAPATTTTRISEPSATSRRTPPTSRRSSSTGTAPSSRKARSPPARSP